MCFYKELSQQIVANTGTKATISVLNAQIEKFVMSHNANDTQSHNNTLLSFILLHFMTQSLIN